MKNNIFKLLLICFLTSLPGGVAFNLIGGSLDTISLFLGIIPAFIGIASPIIIVIFIKDSILGRIIYGFFGIVISILMYASYIIGPLNIRASLYYFFGVI